MKLYIFWSYLFANMTDIYKTPEQSPKEVIIPSAPIKQKQRKVAKQLFSDEASMPHKIKDVIAGIVSHPKFKELDQFSVIQIEECISPSFTRTISDITNDNRFLREMWEHLYLNKELPYG